MAILVAAGDAAAQQCGPQLLHLSSRYAGRDFEDQRADPVAPDRPRDDRILRRISKPDGGFGGVITAAIDSDYFNMFYSQFQLGSGGGISLLRSDGIVLIHWPSTIVGGDLSKKELFTKQLKLNSAGYYKTKSPFDGTAKYIGYEETSQYPLIVTVARSESDLLASWRVTLRTDALVADVVLLSMIILLAALLSSQFRFRLRTERALREREARYRLLADNIADIVILLDGRGILLFVSQSVEPVLGLRGEDLIGKSCFDLVHPDDRDRASSPLPASPVRRAP